MRHGTRLLLFLCIFLLPFSSPSMQAGRRPEAGFCERLKPSKLLPPARAEKILGQPVRLAQEDSVLKGEVRQCNCSYAGVGANATGGQTRQLNFSIEQRENNPSIEQAKGVLAATRAQNAHDTEIRELQGIGDEAILFDNMADRHFLMARKGAIIIRLQIIRAEERSVEELKAFAREVAKPL